MIPRHVLGLIHRLLWVLAVWNYVVGYVAIFYERPDVAVSRLIIAGTYAAIAHMYGKILEWYP